MLLRHFLIGLIIFSMVIASSAILVGDLNSAYGANVSTEFNDTFNQMTSISQDANSMTSSVVNSTGVEVSGSDFWQGTIQSIKLVFKSFALVGGDHGIVNTATKEFLPDAKFAFVGSAIISMIAITLVFIVLSAFMKRPV